MLQVGKNYRLKNLQTLHESVRGQAFLLLGNNLIMVFNERGEIIPHHDSPTWDVISHEKLLPYVDGFTHKPISCGKSILEFKFV